MKATVRHEQLTTGRNDGHERGDATGIEKETCAMKSKACSTDRALEDCNAGSSTKEAAKGLRVTILSLDGIRISTMAWKNDECASSKSEKAASPPASPAMKITAFVGFRSSFPAESMIVPSSHYSSLFQSEGNLLAVESEQVQFPKNNFTSYSDSGKLSPMGVAYWRSCYKNTKGVNADVSLLMKATQHNLQTNDENCNNEMVENEPVPHLEIKLPSTPCNGPTSPRLPDIVELHVCVTCTAIYPLSDNSNNANAKEYRSINSPGSRQEGEKDKRPCDFAENDDTDSQIIIEEETFAENDWHICRGVSHLKVPHSFYDVSNAGDTYSMEENHLECVRKMPPTGRMLRLPIRTTMPQANVNNLNDDEPKRMVVLDNNATISVCVETVSLPVLSNCDRNCCWDPSNGQRHYIKGGWMEGDTGPHYFAPPSVIHHHENSPKSKENKENLGSTTKSWFPRTPRIPIVTNLLLKQALNPSTSEMDKKQHSTVMPTAIRLKQDENELKSVLMSAGNGVGDGSDKAVNNSVVTDDACSLNDQNSERRLNEGQRKTGKSSKCIETDGTGGVAKGVNNMHSWIKTQAKLPNVNSLGQLKERISCLTSFQQDQQEIMKKNTQLLDPHKYQNQTRIDISIFAASLVDQDVAKPAAKPPKSLSKRIREKMICGTPLVDFGEACKTLGAAGHHCDEDYVGLYVYDSQSMSSSIATADLGF